MENEKLKTPTLTTDASSVLNQKTYDAGLFGKSDIYPRSMTKRRIILLKQQIEKMKLGKNIITPKATEQEKL